MILSPLGSFIMHEKSLDVLFWGVSFVQNLIIDFFRNKGVFRFIADILLMFSLDSFFISTFFSISHSYWGIWPFSGDLLSLISVSSTITLSVDNMFFVLSIELILCWLSSFWNVNASEITLFLRTWVISYSTGNLDVSMNAFSYCSVANPGIEIEGSTTSLQLSRS